MRGYSEGTAVAVVSLGYLREVCGLLTDVSSCVCDEGQRLPPSSREQIPTEAAVHFPVYRRVTGVTVSTRYMTHNDSYDSQQVFCAASEIASR